MHGICIACPLPGDDLRDPCRKGHTGSPDRFRARGTAVRLGPGEERAAPRSAGETLLVVLDGRLDVEVAAERYVVGAGEALHFPSGMEQRFVNSGSATADAVVVDVPES